VLVWSAASTSGWQALGDAMTTKFMDAFVERLLSEGEAKGKAEGEANLLLRVMAARGLPIPDDKREQVRSCTDTAQLERWADRAATATSIDDVFPA
jgi:hypothetical protein